MDKIVLYVIFFRIGICQWSWL